MCSPYTRSAMSWLNWSRERFLNHHPVLMSSSHFTHRENREYEAEGDGFFAFPFASQTASPSKKTEKQTVGAFCHRNRFQGFFLTHELLRLLLFSLPHLILFSYPFSLCLVGKFLRLESLHYILLTRCDYKSFTTTSPFSNKVCLFD